MKLDADNVLKGIFRTLTTGSALTERRDELPVIEIDGIKCAVDALNKVVQAGEQREQRWFEVALFDVTPRRFLLREEQVELLHGEDPEWWSVTGSTRMAFVRALSRSKAMQYFAAKYHETATDCELARGFEFVDPTREDLPEELPPAPGFEAAVLAPVGPTMPGCCPHAGDPNHSCGDEGDAPALVGRPRGMRLVVDFPITDADDEIKIVHPDEFEFDANDQTALGAIQGVVDEWESKGVTMDQGGDEGRYELSLEGCEVLELDETIAKAKRILDDVARALRDAGFQSAPAMSEDLPVVANAPAPVGTEEISEDGDDAEFDAKGMKPEDFYFGVGDAGPQGGGKWLTICPKSYWNENHAAYDEHINAEHLFPEYLQHPDDAECLWSIPEDRQTEDVAIDMAVLGFERNVGLEG